MEELLQAFREIQQDVPWRNIFVGLTVLLLGQVVLKGFNVLYYSAIRNWKEQRKALSFRKFCVYTLNIIFILLFLKLIKVDMKVVLGATGLLTLAIGFAARTPISNLISGIFLVFERPFIVGNIIEVNGFKGEVVSRNLLSLTLRTLDNLMVRIPNEMVIGNSVSNISFFPIRRLDIKYLLARKDSLTRLEDVFKEVAGRNGLALDEPHPYFYVSEFKENFTEVIFRVWSSTEDFMRFQSEFPKELHRAVKAAGMEDISQTIEIKNSVHLTQDSTPT